MKCPYCNTDMELGRLDSPWPIVWENGKGRQFLKHLKVPKGAIVLSRNDIKSLIVGYKVKSYLCRSCKKVIVDYSNHDN